MIDKRARQGYFTVFIKRNGKIIDKIEFENRLMNRVLDAEVNLLRGVTTDHQIKYLALGIGTTAITDTDTQLANEQFRTPVTGTPALTSTGVVTSDFVVLETEAPFVIKEIGIFGGASATATVNTGTLLSRVLWTFDKTTNVELNVIRTDSTTRG